MESCSKRRVRGARPCAMRLLVRVTVGPRCALVLREHSLCSLRVDTSIGNSVCDRMLFVTSRPVSRRRTVNDIRSVRTWAMLTGIDVHTSKRHHYSCLLSPPGGQCEVAVCPRPVPGACVGQPPATAAPSRSVGSVRRGSRLHQARGKRRSECVRAQSQGIICSCYCLSSQQPGKHLVCARSCAPVHAM